MNYSYEDLQRIWINAGGSQQTAATAAAIALAESGGNPSSAPYDVDGISYGLWQIHFVHIAGLEAAGIIRSANDLLTPSINAKAAIYISGDGQNYTPWSTWNQYTSGKNTPGAAAITHYLGPASAATDAGTSPGIAGAPSASVAGGGTAVSTLATPSPAASVGATAAVGLSSWLTAATKVVSGNTLDVMTKAAILGGLLLILSIIPLTQRYTGYAAGAILLILLVQNSAT